MFSNFYKKLESISNRFSELLDQTFKRSPHNRGETATFWKPLRKHGFQISAKKTESISNRFSEMWGQTFKKGSSQQGWNFRFFEHFRQTCSQISVKKRIDFKSILRNAKSNLQKGSSQQGRNFCFYDLLTKKVKQISPRKLALQFDVSTCKTLMLTQKSSNWQSKTSFFSSKKPILEGKCEHLFGWKTQKNIEFDLPMQG